ncbi:MAG: ABC transporter permease subunit [Clostridiaceae bacterium]|nr:ABC transporter permease subunit [Clostridiaceae bacterium]
MKTVFREVKKNKVLFLMLAPAIIYVLIFSYIPMAGLIVAFKNFNYNDGVLFSPWNGLENFRFLFLSGTAFKVARNTLGYNLMFLVFGTFTEVMVAVLIAEMSGRYFKKICQGLMFIPFFISWVSVAVIAYNFLNYEMGIVNQILKSVGTEQFDFYGNKYIWIVIFPLLSIWHNVGYGSIIYLAAIVGIEQDVYEAAQIDGANAFQRIHHITLPLLKPTVVIMVLLALGRLMRGNFEMFYQIVGTDPLVYDTTDIIDTFVFRALTNGSDYGMSTAAGFIQSILCFVMILAANWFVKLFDKDYALF